VIAKIIDVVLLLHPSLGLAWSRVQTLAEFKFYFLVLVYWLL